MEGPMCVGWTRGAVIISSTDEELTEQDVSIMHIYLGLRRAEYRPSGNTPDPLPNFSSPVAGPPPNIRFGSTLSTYDYH